MEKIGKTREARLYTRIREDLLPSIITGLEATGLVKNVSIRLRYDNRKNLQKVEIMYQRARGTKCAQFHASLDALFLTNFVDRGITLEHIAEKKRKTITARVNGFDTYQGNKTELLYELCTKAKDTIWNYADPSREPKHQLPKKRKKDKKYA